MVYCNGVVHMFKSQKIELVLLDTVLQWSDPSGRSFHIADLTPYLSNEVGNCEHREVVAALQRLFKNSRITIGQHEGDDWIPYDLSDGTEMFYGHTFKYAALPDAWPYAKELRKGDKAGIFISHISEERELASHIQTFLRQAFGDAFPVFVSSDYKSIKSGQPWYNEILGGLRKAQVVMVLLTPASIDRRWINFESGFGMGQDAEVIPLALGLMTREIGLPLGQLQARDLSDLRDVEQLLVDIGSACGIKLGPVDSRGFKDELSRLEGKVRTKKLEFLVRRRNNQLQFAIRNSGSSTIDLIDAVILVPNVIVGQGFFFRNEPPVRLGMREKIGEITYEGFRLTSTPSSRAGGQIEPLPSAITQDMGTRELRSVQISLKPHLSDEERNMTVRLRLSGKQANAGELSVRVSDLPPDWPD